jgi:RNA polymerase sigma factor (sigma-70 family)
VVRTAARRGEEWFTAVYAAHYPDIVRYGLRRLGDVDPSTELAQEVFVIAWRRRADVPDRSLPWLYGVARRLLANHWRATRTRPVVRDAADPDQLGTDGDEMDSAAGIADITAALSRLSAEDQEILRLVCWEQLTIDDAVVALRCSRTAAKVRLHRARRRLRDAMTVGNAPAVPRRATTRI